GAQRVDCAVLEGARIMQEFPRAVLFDLDGTLIDSAGGIAWALDRTLVELGRAGSGEAEGRAWIGAGAGVLLRRALRDGGSALADDEGAFEHAFARLMHRYAESLPRPAESYPGAEEALHGLRGEGVRVALCS